MDDYKCYYCTFSTRQFGSIVQHCTEFHSNEIIKYRQLVVNELTGKIGYQTKIHNGLIPSVLKQEGRNVIVSGNRLAVTEHAQRKKLNTPSKYC